jgi:single-strand DNA-binding protein
MACVAGRLQIRAWTDKDGNKRRTAEIVADNVYFADSKNATENGGNRPTAAAHAAGGFAPMDCDDEELPF